jgi:hypothetical protein
LFETQHGPLRRTYRPWDPILPDGKRVYRPLVPRKHGFHGAGYGHGYGQGYEYGSEYVVPPYPLPQQNFHGQYEDEIPAPVEENIQRPFLSDEAVPLPEARSRRRVQR